MQISFQVNFKQVSYISLWLTTILLILSPIALGKENKNPPPSSRRHKINYFQEKNLEIASIGQPSDNRYSDIDKKAFSIKYAGNSVSELASVLSQYATSDPDKARIIYAWIANNITYDVDGFLSGQYGDLGAKKVLSRRTGVCTGYANLYQALAQSMGLETVVIEGYAKGVGYGIGTGKRLRHAWNAVKFNDRWHLLDSTWGAGVVSGQQFVKIFNPHYFATKSEHFIYDHYPNDPAWQLLSNPFSKAEFDRLPTVSAQFFRDGLSFLNPNRHTIKTYGKAVIVLEAPSDVMAVLAVSKSDQDLNKSYSHLRRQGRHLVAHLDFPDPGNYKVYIFSKRSNKPGGYNYAADYNVISY